MVEKNNLSKNSRAVVVAYEKGYRVTRDGKVLNGGGDSRGLSEDGRGYLRFNVAMDGEAYPVDVHRLQAYQKFGDEIFKDGIQVRHLDNDSKNNTWDNIGIGTQSDNMLDIPKERRIRQARNNAKLTAEEVKEIRDKVSNNNYTTYGDLANEYNIASKGNISDIVNYNTWKHI